MFPTRESVSAVGAQPTNRWTKSRQRVSAPGLYTTAEDAALARVRDAHMHRNQDQPNPWNLESATRTGSWSNFESKVGIGAIRSTTRRSSFDTPLTKYAALLFLHHQYFATRSARDSSERNANATHKAREDPRSPLAGRHVSTSFTGHPLASQLDQ